MARGASLSCTWRVGKCRREGGAPRGWYQAAWVKGSRVKFVAMLGGLGAFVRWAAPYERLLVAGPGGRSREWGARLVIGGMIATGAPRLAREGRELALRGTKEGWVGRVGARGDLAGSWLSGRRGSCWSRVRASLGRVASGFAFRQHREDRSGVSQAGNERRTNEGQPEPWKLYRDCRWCARRAGSVTDGWPHALVRGPE